MSAFDEFRSIQRDITTKCVELELIWAEATRQLEVETIRGSNLRNANVVEDLLSEVRSRISSSMIEVGVFGFVKRGKSTLLNALLGLEASPMNVLPETAVPVWIRNGPNNSTVLFEDGHVEEKPFDVALRMSSQDYVPAHPNDKPTRIEHALPIKWLPEGVRIIDTPGLADPSLIADYEELTLAELDRVAAVIFVLSSPPGPGSEELAILQSLSHRAVDKLFLVCNFYQDQWTDPLTVQQMVENVKEATSAGTNKGVGQNNQRVFPVSALEGFRASIAGDLNGLAESGIVELRQDLESYLLEGAVLGLANYVQRRLDQIVNIILDTLFERKKILINPSSVEARKRELEVNISASNTLLAEIQATLHQTSTEVSRELTTVFQEPYRALRPEVEKLDRISEVEDLFNRLRIQLETAVSRATTLCAQRAGLVEIKLQRRLYESFGIEERLSLQDVALDVSNMPIDSPRMPVIEADHLSTAAGAIIGAAALGTVGGVTAVGAGLAFLAILGPLGWLAGAGLGILFGAGGGAVVSKYLTRGRLDERARTELLNNWNDHERKIATDCVRQVAIWANEAEVRLSKMRDRYYAQKQDELVKIISVLNDTVSRTSEIARIEALIGRLTEVRS